MPARKRPIAVVGGPLANKSGNGGIAWVCLNWMLGLEQVGFEVYFVEQIARASCVGATGKPSSFDDSENLRVFRQVTAAFSERAALVYENGEQIHGADRASLVRIASDAEILVNLSGHLRWPALFDRFRRKIYIDLDPGFTQFWQAAGNPGAHLEGHDAYFTVGANIGTAGCSIPTVDITWHPIRPPIVLSKWPACPMPAPGRFTTVASWRGAFGPITHAGTSFGLKVHEFRKLAALPARLPCGFEIALDIHPADEADRQLLLRNNWRLASPSVAATPELFQRYVQDSAAEFSAAQGIYVETHSGWFSDRTACYLASGKPALVQDTGFSRNYPVGLGLVPFRTLDEAVSGANAILADYSRHSEAARAVAETYFDAGKVLGGVLASDRVR